MIGQASVCLNMIVKNESKVIARCLNAARPLVDHWVIVDTGSTDGTQELVRASMGGVPGELHERPWRNFGANRSEALELARGKADYTLIVDADEVLEVAADFSPPVLTHDAYQLKTELRELAYYRTELVRSSLPWRWEGVLHEYLECAAPFTQARLEGIVNRPHTDGARSADPKKYQKDAELLEQALDAQPDNQRYRFYLAQSYRDAGRPEKALEHYQRRAAAGGWAEEVWYSLFEVARLSERLERPEPVVVTAYLAAHEFRPTRAESLCALARYERLRKHYAQAYLFAKHAASIAAPADILFVDTSVYAWRARDEWSIAAYYVGRHDEALQVTSALLADPRLPQAERARVAANREFSVKALA
jgi:glycosyltransferase involved in cell wall biosynthesis